MQKISTGSTCLTAAAMVVVLLAAAATTTTTVTAAEPSVDCLTPLLVCLSYLNSTNPSKDCCNAIEAVISNSAEVACLCNYYNNPGELGPFNITQALMLPKYCGLNVDPATMCKAMAPGGSSMPPPAPGNNDSNAAGGIISWTGSATLFLVLVLTAHLAILIRINKDF